MAQTQNYGAESVELLAAAFPRRSENSFAWGNAISYYLGLPQLRGFWPMSSVNEAGNPYDLSGQGRALTNNNSATYGIYGLQSYTALDGANQYHSRVDEAGLDIIGDLTIGAWIYPTANQLGGIVCKYQALPYSYGTFRRATQVVGFDLYGGGGLASIDSTDIAPLNTWTFTCGRYIPSTSVMVAVNDNFRSNLVAVPATANNTVDSFTIGNVIGNYFSGYVTLAFICAASCSDAQIKALYWLTRSLFFGS